MARNDSLNNYLQDVGNAIKEKLGTNEKILATDFDTKIKGIKSGGLEINGIIEEYQVAAGENVNAGDFVTYMNSEYGKETQLYTKSNQSLLAIDLGNDKVFVSYVYKGGTYDYNLYGSVLKISNLSIEVEIDTKLLGSYSTDISQKLISLGNNRIFISYAINNSLYGMICEINGNQIEMKNSVSLNDSAVSVLYSTELIKDNKILIIYTRKTNQYMFGKICVINGTSITAGTSTQLNTRISGSPHLCLFDNNKLFIAYSNNYYNGYYLLYGFVCMVDDANSITTGTDTQLSTDDRSGVSYDATLLDNKNIFIYHSKNDKPLCGLVCKIDNLSITTGVTTQLNSIYSDSYYPNMVSLKNNRISLIYSYGENTSSYCLYGLVCEVKDMEVLVGENTILSKGEYYSSSVIAKLIGNNRILVTHSLDDNENDPWNDKSYIMECVIDDLKITRKREFSLLIKADRVDYPYILLDYNRLLMLYCPQSPSYTHASIIKINLVKKTKESQDETIGITRTNGVAGQIVEVYTYNPVG